MTTAAELATKLQVKPGRSVALLGLPDGVELPLPAGCPVVDDVWSALRFRPG
jgi:hypothetical protein